MIVPVVVEGQSLRWYGRIPEIADNSIEFVQLEFRFPEDWDSMVIVAQFTQAKTYNCLLVNNRCFLPMELVAGPCEVSVFGYLNEEVTRGTTIPLKLNISRSGFVSSAETPIPPTPDLYAQLIEYFSSIAGSGGGGSGGGTINPEDIAAAVEDYLSKNPPAAYTLPIATETTLGGVKAAAATEEMTQPVGITAEGKLVTVPGQNSGGNVDLTGYATEQYVQDYAQPKGNYLTEHQDISGKLDASELPTAINTALAQAKASGEFNGKDGQDYVLTHDDKTEIAEMAAELVDVPGSGGNVDLTGYAKEQWVQENYQPKGDYALKSQIPTVPTKVSAFENDKGYLTEHQDISGKLDADKLPEAVNDALAQAKASGEFDGKDGKDGLDATPITPLFAQTIEECTDTTKPYVLPDGFIYAYMMTEVSGTVERDGFTVAVDTDGTPFNGGQGWIDGYRLNSSGVQSQSDGMSVTGYIPVKSGDVVTIKNAVAGGSSARAHVYGSNFAWLQMISSDVANPTLTITTENAAYFRFTARFYQNHGTNPDTVITVTTEGGTTKEYAWANTGHAFVPADYEDRIIDAEEAIEEHETRIANLENRSVDGVPDYVVAEAEEVIDKVISAQDNRTFTLAAITDMHYGNGSYTDGLVHACQAMRYIDSRIKLDAVSVLGDYTDGFTGTGYDNAIGDFKAINAELNGLRFAPNLRVHGNHDHYEMHSPVLYRYIAAYSDDVVWGSKPGGYFYRDFEDFKLRIICLNTAEENDDGLSCSTEQYNWFAGAIDLSSKADMADWQTLILSHHPLDWFHSNNSGYVFWQILNAYLNGTSWNGFNYAGKNSAKIVGNIHGHIHNLLTRNIAAGQPNTTESTINVVRIATPEACYDRPNSYNDAWDYNPFGEETSYPKTKGTAEDTAFCIYCIDLDAHTIKAICYGAGYDREISY